MEAIDRFPDNLAIVLDELERNVLDLLGTAKTGSVYDAGVLLNSRPQMLQALRDAGYYDLAEQFVQKYGDSPAKIRSLHKRRKLPPPHFSTADIAKFQQIATADLEMFGVLGARAMDELRLGLFRHAVSNRPFSVFVEEIRLATVGTTAKGSPLANYAYTHANTALLKYQGEVAIVAGESIGADKWEVVGPLDGATRQVCQEALARPIRTREEWEAVDYWGGAPGGWNCRHQLIASLKG